MIPLFMTINTNISFQNFDFDKKPLEQIFLLDEIIQNLNTGPVFKNINNF
jgi:hypothetical protein